MSAARSSFTALRQRFSSNVMCSQITQPSWGQRKVQFLTRIRTTSLSNFVCNNTCKKTAGSGLYNSVKGMSLNLWLCPLPSLFPLPSFFCFLLNPIPFFLSPISLLCPVTSPSSSPDACFFKQDKGGCENYTLKWYFDTTQSKCSRFWYGGCGGNGNRFETQEACEGLCLRRNSTHLKPWLEWIDQPNKFSFKVWTSKAALSV